MESIALRKTQPSDNDLNQETNNNMVNDDNLNDIMLIYEWVDSFNLISQKNPVPFGVPFVFNILQVAFNFFSHLLTKL